MNAVSLDDLPNELKRLTKLTDMCGGENTIDEVLATWYTVKAMEKIFRRTFLLDRIYAVACLLMTVAFVTSFGLIIYLTSWPLTVACAYVIPACVCGVCAYRARRRRPKWRAMVAEIGLMDTHFQDLTMRCVREKLERDLRKPR